jgi:hypothetical protein
MFAQRRRYDVSQMHRCHAERKAGDRGVHDARVVCVFTRACGICEMIARIQTAGTRGMGMQAESPSVRVTDNVTVPEYRCWTYNDITVSCGALKWCCGVAHRVVLEKNRGVRILC